ncbi:Hamartin [Nymphon striatum]|nr:Hamartin [Nymphon striatum]
MMNVSQIKNLVDWSKLFGVMEYGENPNAEEIKQIILENLSAGMFVSKALFLFVCADLKSSYIVNSTVDYYLETQSTICLEIMSGVRGHHEKHLFEKLNECIKSAGTRTISISLLGQLIKKQPSWLPKIVHHPVLMSLFRILKTDNNILNICNGVYTIVILLPTVPSFIKQHLQDIFEIFSRLVIFHVKPGNVPQVHILHLNVTLFEMFSRLYGMYPCHFITYLRQCINSYKEDKRIRLLDGIKPMMLQVRLHPSLVTNQKEYEVSMERWKKMEPHDVIVECAKITNLGAIGTNSDSLQNSQNILTPSFSSNIDNVNSFSSQHHSSVKVSTGNDSMALYSLTNSQSAAVINSSNQNGILWNTYKDGPLYNGRNCSSALTVKKNSDEASPEIINNSGNKNKNFSAQTSINCSQPSTPLKKENIFQFPPSSPDFVPVLDNQSQIEDKLEKPLSKFHNDKAIALQDITDINDSRDDGFQYPGQAPKCDEIKEMDTVEGLKSDEEVEFINRKTLEEQDFDTANHSGQITPLSRRNSRFESSTPKSVSNYTPQKTFDNDSNFQASIECSIDQNDSQSMTRIIKNMNRLRFLSQCEPNTLSRRKSCSDLCFVTTIGVDSYDDTQKARGVSNESGDYRKFSLPITPNSTDLLSMTKSASNASGEPCHSQTTSTVSSCQTVSEAQRSFSLKHFEILENYLLLGSDIHCSTVPLTSSGLTHWTHFGGQPPPDEIKILRDQIQLFQYQLVYERYKREIHAQRNRRLLSKAKDAKALVEQNIAMVSISLLSFLNFLKIWSLKDQLELQEKEVQHLRNQVKQFQNQIKELNCAENNESNLLLSKLRDLTRENENLKFSNGKLRELLVSHTDENNKLKEELKHTKGQCFDIKKEIGIMQEHITFNSRLKSQIDTLNQELMLMGELHQRYREKYSHPVSSRETVYKYEMFQEVADKQISCRLNINLSTILEHNKLHFCSEATIQVHRLHGLEARWMRQQKQIKTCRTFAKAKRKKVTTILRRLSQFITLESGVEPENVESQGSLKEGVQEKEIIFLAQKAHNAELEKALSKKDAVIAELKQLLERTKVGHVEKLEAVEMKHVATIKVCQDLQVYVQELNNQLEIQERSQEEKEKRDLQKENWKCKLPSYAVEAIKYHEENVQELLDNSQINTSTENLSTNEPNQDGAEHSVLNSDNDTSIVSSKDNGEV